MASFLSSVREVRGTLIGAVSLMIAFIGSFASAHPGGVDEEGCHVDARSGKRHCHGHTFDASKPARAGDEGVFFGPLVKVIDGDTFVVKIQGVPMEIRLAGIDAPEHDQPFGTQAREQLRALIGGQQCVLVPIDTDRYGRTIAHLWIGNTYANRELVRRGAAWFYTEFANDAALYATENAARDAKRGLWALPVNQRIEPWEWRNARRAPKRLNAKP